MSGRDWLYFREMFFPQGNWNCSPGNGQVAELKECLEFWDCPGAGLGDPCDSLPAQGIPWAAAGSPWSCQQRRRPSKSRPPPGCGPTLGQGKPLLPLEKPVAQPRGFKSRKISWFPRFLHVWTRMFLGCVDSPEVPQLLTTTHQQRFIPTP